MEFLKGFINFWTTIFPRLTSTLTISWEEIGFLAGALSMMFLFLSLYLGLVYLLEERRG